MGIITSLIKYAMPAMLKHWRPIAVIMSAALIICMASYYRMRMMHLQRENIQLESMLGAAEAKAAANHAALNIAKLEYDKRLESVEASASCELSREKKVENIKKEISHDQDAPVAPVLLNAIDRLREARSPANRPTAR